MYPRERQALLLTLLSQQGFASYQDLAERLQVSEITIRRDMKALRDQGLVEKAFGGAQVARAARELPYTSKQIMQMQEKEMIAAKARALIENGMTIAFAAGTTTWVTAKAIAGFSDLTFLTNSTNIARDLRANGWTEIHLTGGLYSTPSDAMVGPIAELAAKQFHTDILFIGTNGLHIDHGLSTPNLLEASINRVLMEHTDKVVLLADQSKWVVEAMCRFGGLDEIDVLVTDGLPSQLEERALRANSVEIIMADPSTATL